jgi:hypothetical protein
MKLPNIVKFGQLFNPTFDNSVEKVINVNEIYEFVVYEFIFIGLQITFGAIFPPLAVVLLMAILTETYCHQVLLGRFISYVLSSNIHSRFDMLEDNLKGLPLLSTLEKCGWFLLYTACCFYTLFLFDILGDSVGFYKAYWVLIVMPCIPLSLHASYLLIKWIITYRRKSTPTTPIHMDTQIQMNPLVRSDSAKLGRDSSIRDLSIEDRYSQSLKE